MTRVALVVGGSRGIGRACAVRLANDGFDAVVVGYRADDEAAAGAVAAIDDAGAHAVAVRADATDDDGLARLLVAAAEAGTLAAVVYAAGHRTLGPTLELDPVAWQRALDVTLTGFVRTAHAAASAMDGGGAIVGISGLSGVRAYSPQHLTMGTAKAASHHAAAYLGQALAPRGINLNIVCCGSTRTEGVERDLTKEQYREFVLGAAARIPIGRIAEPAEIASVVSFLCSPDARLLVGQVLVADGGETLR
ncbi:MAG TPA: SDR family oxidoreductase [Acidimicrobiales bacterium]|nr:SDR family oxidoreductase [Acidimicrobiales bacterium]